jgi:excisionase family DNA binding protein
MSTGAPRIARVAGATVIDDALLALVAPVFQLAVRNARRNGRAVDPELLLLVSAAESAEAAMQVARRKPQVAASDHDAASSRTATAHLTASEVALRLGISSQAVTKAARDGRVAGQRAGRDWNFDPREVEAWAARRRGA